MTLTSAETKGNAPEVDVCLVHMPFSDLEYPTIGLGLIKTYLADHDISSRIFYPTFDFAHRTGLSVYKRLANSSPSTLIGEWVFARAAFREQARPDEPFFHWLLEDMGSHWQSFQGYSVDNEPETDAEKFEWLEAVRDEAGPFVEEVALRVLESKPRIVGCTSVFQQHCASLAVLRRIKELAPECITMMGGANCEEVMGEATHRHFPWVDFVMSGEVDGFIGEFTRLMLDEGLEAAAGKAPRGVYGPLHRQSEVEPSPFNAPRGVLKTMDEAAVPDFDDFFAELDASDVSEDVYPGLVFESSRGCWWGEKHHCKFCGMNDLGLVFRSKSPERVYEELMTLRRKYKVGFFLTTDAIIDMKHLRSVLPMLSVTKGRPYLFYEVKANLRREEVKLLSLGGVRVIQPGIESLHDDFLTLVDKGNRWFTNVQLLKWSQESGINVNWNFLAGAPGEKESWYQELAEWLPLLYHLEPPGAPFLIRIRYDRYSIYQSEPERFGLDLKAYKAYELVYPLESEALVNMAYFFEDANEDAVRLAPDCDGYEQTNARLWAWKAAFHGQDGAIPARLIATDDGERITIQDSRPVRVKDTHTLEGLDRVALIACESGQSLKSLTRILKKEGRLESEEEILASLERLTEAKLALEWRDRILSLPVNGPVMRYLTPSERPGTRHFHKTPQPSVAEVSAT